ncbi:MAG: 2-C-methyl-D-erythritol 4-phosphate cytidylyltransferase [Actinobacteria bacterium]|nr:2-C-methyl-D-erythritol 4-phosphate cytidylyltransferase [Actinomycetota bacterium]MCG2800057.1 2-C-methyl-D-erythritol 4-phosphate cytidylyltransferase [Cellulomonas sp.]
MSVAAILTAAGSGTRLGRDEPKAFVPVDGSPLLLHAAKALLDAVTPAGERIDQLVVTVPAGLVARAGELLTEACGSAVDLWVVEGGGTRQASVAAGLAAVRPEVDLVLVHDAARAFAPAELVARVMAAVRAGRDAVVPGLPLVDTVKRVGEQTADGDRPVVGTVPRAELVSVQTPQGFDRTLLVRAHAAGRGRAGDESSAASDDAGLVEELGAAVWVVPGDRRAAKITTAEDLVVARMLAADA